MSTGMTGLEEKINQFESLLAEMKEATREAHSTMKEMRNLHREIEKMLNEDVKELVKRESTTIVVTELAKISPVIRSQTNAIYDRVGKQIDKLIDLSLGKEFRHDDLRPKLAVRLREWIREIVDDETNKDERKDFDSPQ